MPKYASKETNTTSNLKLSFPHQSSSNHLKTEAFTNNICPPKIMKRSKAYTIIVADATDNVCGAKKFTWSKIASHVKYFAPHNKLHVI